MSYHFLLPGIFLSQELNPHLLHWQVDFLWLNHHENINVLLLLFSHSLCPTLCDPIDCSTPGLPVLHYLPEFAQSHVHWVNDAIQSSHPLLPLSPPAASLSQHQGLFQSRLISIGKGVCQHCILSTCLFNVYAYYIKRNAGLDEAQARIKISGRNINNLRYADDTTLTAESGEELKILLMKVKEGEWKSWLKTQHSESKDHGIRSHHFTADRWGNSGNCGWLYFLGSKITADGDCSHEIKRHLLLGRKVMTNLDRILKSRDITLPQMSI